MHSDNDATGAVEESTLTPLDYTAALVSPLPYHTSAIEPEHEGWSLANRVKKDGDHNLIEAIEEFTPTLMTQKKLYLHHCRVLKVFHLRGHVRVQVLIGSSSPIVLPAKFHNLHGVFT
jgi:hypothetical protein